MRVNKFEVTFDNGATVRIHVRNEAEARKYIQESIDKGINRKSAGRTITGVRLIQYGAWG